MTLCGNKDLAQELAQETFFKAMKTDKAAFRGESDVITWLCSIAKNLYYDEMRKSSRHTDLPDDNDIESDINVEKDILNEDAVFRIHLILHEMDEPYKEVFELRVFGELSFRQIGMIFGKTENWARVTYHRARLKIQERMDSKNE